jgi:SAM-dependent methyltransferase
MTNPATPVARDDWEGHWRDYTDAAAHNPAQRYRRQLACKLLRDFGCSRGARILDIGSGQGDLAVDLHCSFPESKIAGLELSATGVEVSRRKIPTAQFVQRDLLQRSGAGPLRHWAKFAVCSEVLEHLDDPGRLLANASEYLAPGCALVVTVPGGPKSEFDLYIGHRQHFTPASLASLLEAQGFTVELATTAGFPFFNLYRLIVILRGKHLITDVDGKSHGWKTTLARAVMALFRPLFALNLTGTQLGWQTIAVARFVGRTPASAADPLVGHSDFVETSTSRAGVPGAGQGTRPTDSVR